MHIPAAQEIYRHFKGNLYRIITIAEHSETGEQMVVYQALYGDMKVYARELTMFVSPVDREKYPEAGQEMCFELVPEGPVVAVSTPTQPEAGMTEAGMTEAAKTEVVKPEAEKPEAVKTEGEAYSGSLDPNLERFLDANTYQERMEYLRLMRDTLTDSMITTMAICCDIDMPEGSIEMRYESLYNALATKHRFECTRLRE